MPGTGLEPARLSAPDPKSGASANSATLARNIQILGLGLIPASRTVLLRFGARSEFEKQSAGFSCGAGQFALQHRLARRFNQSPRRHHEKQSQAFRCFAAEICRAPELVTPARGPKRPLGPHPRID